MSRKSRSSKEYIKELEGLYDNMDSLEQVVVDTVNSSPEFLPVGYSYKDVIEWMQRQKYILKENGKLRIKVK